MDNKLLEIVNRRQFIKRASAFAIAVPAVAVVNGFCQTETNQQQQMSAGIVGGYCEGCEGIYELMPWQIGSQTTIAPASEPGEPMEISGIIYRSDGKTPARDVILYVYHTDAKGYYSPAPGATGNVRRHGHLRGWVKTDAKGEYKFITIKPAPYPGRKDPAHIHPIVKEPDKNEYYIDAYVFDDDPLLTGHERSKLDNRGGSGIVQLSRNGNGVWTGRRNIILGLNVANYR